MIEYRLICLLTLLPQEVAEGPPPQNRRADGADLMERWRQIGKSGRARDTYSAISQTS